jgi:polysaccharide export outer membrane protein
MTTERGLKALKRYLAVSILIVLTVSASAWAAEKEKANPSPSGAVAQPETFGPQYRIGPGDLLGIEVWKDPSLTRAVIVLPDGKITFPLIGEIVAGGKTVGQLKDEIEEKLSRYVEQNLVLTVEVRQLNSMHVYVLGQVNSPGRVVLTSNINVLQALAAAGGPTQFADRSDIRIFRQKGGGTVIIPFDYDDVTAGKKLETNILLRRGDVVFVP